MSSSTQAPPKKNKGRQKVEMVKMANENHLQVTFSKRRAGLFKKASDLCTLCGAKAVVVVFSPANKVFSFGHPNVDAVANRFLNELPPNTATNLTEVVFETQRNSTIRGLNLELTQLEAKLRMERRRGEKLDQVRKLGQLQKWYPESLDELNATQLYGLKEGFLELKRNFHNAVQKRTFGASNPHDFHPRGVGGETENSINLCGFSFGSGSNVGGHDDFHPLVNGSKNENCVYPNGFLFGSGSNGCGNNILTFPTEQLIGSNEPNAHGNIVPTLPTEMPIGSNELNVCGNNVHTFISQMPIGSSEPNAHGNIVPTFQFGSNENVDTFISQMPIGSNEPNAHGNIVPTFQFGSNENVDTFDSQMPIGSNEPNAHGNIVSTFPTEMPIGFNEANVCGNNVDTFISQMPIGSNPSCSIPTNPFAITDPNPNYTLSSIVEGFCTVTNGSNNAGGNNDIDPTTSPGESSGYLVVPATTFMIPGYFD